MTTKTALLALLAMWGVGGACIPMAAIAEEAATEAADSDATPAKRSFTNRVWVKQGGDDDLPGIMRIFLSDGTLVQDSCWETHRLSAWRMTSPTEVTWNEDGADIDAEIVSLSGGNLVLSVKLVGGAVEERYTAADVPYVCPDMPKD